MGQNAHPYTMGPRMGPRPASSVEGQGNGVGTFQPEDFRAHSGAPEQNEPVSGAPILSMHGSEYHSGLFSLPSSTRSDMVSARRKTGAFVFLPAKSSYNLLQV